MSMSFLKKKATRKELEARNKETIKFWSRKYQEAVEDLNTYRKGVTELQATVDILLGNIIKTYGKRNGDAIILNVPETHKRYNVGMEIVEGGYELCATEVRDETV